MEDVKHPSLRLCSVNLMPPFGTGTATLEENGTEVVGCSVVFCRAQGKSTIILQYALSLPHEVP